MRRRAGRLPSVAAALAVVLALVATACSSGSSSGATKPPDGVLRVGLERPQSLDPAEARYPADLLLVDQLFDGLTAYDPGTLQVVPALASRWESTPDQKTWSFFLRPGAKFANGRAITSTDVQYTLERIAKRGSDSPSAPQLDPIVGFKAFNDGKANTLAGITTPAAGTVKFDLAYPLASFPSLLAYPAFGIVPREAVEAQPPAPAFAEQPVGSGPFMFRSRSADVLRLMPAAGVKTQLKEVDVYLSSSSDEAYSAFLRGRLDWTAVPTDRVDEVVKNRGRAGFEPYPAALFYGFNLKNPKFANPQFREAIVHAIDRASIVQKIYGGTVRPSNGVVAEGVPGYQPNACGDKCAYDPTKAKALLTAAFGSKAVPEINIDFDDDPTQQAVAAAMQANLKAVGITANLRPHTYTDYLKFASSGKQEMFRLAWIGAYASPDAFLTPLFYSDRSDNVTGFKDKDFDALIRAAREQPDAVKSLEIYKTAEQYVMAQLPVIPIAQYETHTLASSRVRDLTMSAFGTFDASRVRLVS